ncbi:hypothetical protein LX32DRAFT_119072 [Colletotrichum zoysiae]|uniref:Uncharacterized protein n=1 Tax=Colletotrichum zoysiae TaxID=1216348 RepID=A0AAD9H9U5_9PEZI|nr:hypothetical protein LX32DRAFT_119072 [Colletotrichum zoysiae]
MREREREGGREGGRERERERTSKVGTSDVTLAVFVPTLVGYKLAVCVCVCACVSVVNPKFRFPFLRPYLLAVKLLSTDGMECSCQTRGMIQPLTKGRYPIRAAASKLNPDNIPCRVYRSKPPPPPPRPQLVANAIISPSSHTRGLPIITLCLATPRLAERHSAAQPSSSTYTLSRPLAQSRHICVCDSGHWSILQIRRVFTT